MNHHMIIVIMVVLPAASKPTMRILMSFFPNSWLKIDEKVIPIAGNIVFVVVFVWLVISHLYLYENTLKGFASNNLLGDH